MSAVDVLVVGAGFFGCQVALAMRAKADRVAVVERCDDVLQRASFANQARVHNGYHYPRSVLTALRSRVNFPRFCRDFEECVVASFRKYYAVARHGSKVSADQFAEFCRRIEAPLREAPEAVQRWFEADLIERVWEVEEVAFDAHILAARTRRDLEANGIILDTGWTVVKVRPLDQDAVEVIAVRADGQERRWRTRWLFNCTYSGINQVLSAGGLTPVPLKHELAEMALVAVPDSLRSAGITVMCGPFFSVMPFPSRGLHTFSHVRYTPHGAWEERQGDHWRLGRPAEAVDFKRVTKFPHMVRDAARYLPLLQDCRQVDSLWELKTLLPQSEGDDSRPILFRRDERYPRIISVMGGKIDNVYDLPAELERLAETA